MIFLVIVLILLPPLIGSDLSRRRLERMLREQRKKEVQRIISEMPELVNLKNRLPTIYKRVYGCNSDLVGAEIDAQVRAGIVDGGLIEMALDAQIEKYSRT